MKNSNIHPVYAAWWGLLVGTMLVGEFVGYPGWVLPAQLIGFIVVEAIALRRKARGDTLSEMVWSATRGDRHAGPIAWAVGIYLPLRFSMITLDVIPEWIPIAVLTAGIIGWLIPHFNSLGK